MPNAVALRGDAASTESALVVAALAMLALGTGGWLWWWRSGFGDLQGVFIKSVLFGTVVSFACWLGWLVVVYALLQRLATTVIPMDRLIREAGLATAPLALGLLMALPLLSFPIGLVAIAAWVVSIQQAIERASDLRGVPVFLANLAGFALWAGVLSLLTTASQPLAPGPFLAESVWEAIAHYKPAITN